MVVAGHGAAIPAWSPLELTRGVAEALDKRVAVADSEVQVRTHVLQGNPGPQIVRFVEDNRTDLIVIGSHGLRGVSRWLLGSVTEKVVRGATCPVLILRGPAEEAAAPAAAGKEQVG